MPDVMMPATPLPKLASVMPIVPGGWQGGATGGAESWVGFMGARWSVKLQSNKLKPEPDGRLWAAAIADGLMGNAATGGSTGGVIVGCRFYQPGLKSVAVPTQGGAITLDGANQSGAVLKLKGFQPNALVRRHEFFNVVSGGKQPLYRATAETVADADGKMSLPIGPMLHVPPFDGDLCVFGEPLIEGKLTVEGNGWTHIPAFVDSLTFTISEVR